MNTATMSRDDALARNRAPAGNPGHTGAAADTARSSSAAAISWGAIAGGAAAAAALSLILLMLGLGLGLSSVSPWARGGVGATALGLSTIIWLTVTQLLASGMGGYLAGRLRTRWTDAQADEVYFRDTAHGFLAWAVATLATAALLTSAVGSIVGSGVQAGATLGVAGTTAAVGSTGNNSSNSSSSGEAGPLAYWVDALFRRPASTESAGAGGPAPASNPAAGASETAEMARIFMQAAKPGPLPPEDLRHVAQTVAQRTGLAQAAAEQRVADIYSRAQTQLREAETTTRAAADRARKATAASALWMFVSLLVGAFVASLAATWGGRSRDA